MTKQFNLSTALFGISAVCAGVYVFSRDSTIKKYAGILGFVSGGVGLGIWASTNKSVHDQIDGIPYIQFDGNGSDASAPTVPGDLPGDGDDPRDEEMAEVLDEKIQ